MEISSRREVLQKERLYDIDWLRVLAVLLLVPFHSALVFNLDPNAIVYMKDAVHSDFLDAMAGFIHRWHMPLLFFLAGSSTWLALGLRTNSLYLKERVKRLFVPFVFSLPVLIPPMTYVQFLDQASPPDFLRHFAGFWKLDPADLSGRGGTLTVAHLWFILFLFFFSVCALPLFAWLRGSKGQRLAARLAAWCEKPGAVLFFPGLLLTAASAVPLLGAMNPVFYISVFILGGLAMTDRRFREAIEKHLLAALLLGTAAAAIGFIAPADRYGVWSWQWMALGTLYVFSRWWWVVVFVGAGRRLLNRTNAVLEYAVEAAYPFYILHLPAVTLVTWFMIKLGTVIAVKYALIVLISIGLTCAVFELFIKRIGFMRVLFGMKPRI